jgi:hypothetical protein
MVEKREGRDFLLKRKEIKPQSAQRSQRRETREKEKLQN